ncbi:hypothetical protein I4U23_015700 [Adineta vaga]|nr:hypothetical protein I4U23_015700 [Adineta vaga]
MKSIGLFWLVLMMMILYTLQGFIQGFATSIPLFLASYKASWKEQGTFSWVSYPFSCKILWAPIIDSIYSRRLGGRHQTWLVPIQITVGLILLVLSFYLEYLLMNLRVVFLAIIFFMIFFLIATQDIVVDGWTLVLFASSNPQWSSTCQTAGEMIGRFFGSTVLMTFESANFTNKYIRETFSLPHRSYGLFTLEQYTFFWGVAFILVSLIIGIVFFVSKLRSNNTEEEQIEKLNLWQTYLDIFHLLKKRCVQQFALILLTFNLGFAATYYMTNLTLVGYGVTRDTIALMNIPLLIIHIIVPLCLSQTRSPLKWFAWAYIPRLFASILLAIYIFFTPQLLFKPHFYPLLLMFICLNEGLCYLLKASRIGVYARVSEPRIGGTYMTLLATISNLGQSLSSTIVLYVAEWLPKQHAYSIQVAACFILGFLWIGLMWRMIIRLDALPVEEWHLKPKLQPQISAATTISQINIA